MEKRLVVLFILVISTFSVMAQDVVTIQGTLAVNASYVTLRGEIMGSPLGVTKSHRQRVRLEGITFNLWSGGVPFCKSGVYKVPLDSILHGSVDRHSKSFRPLMTIINASDLKCQELGMPSWEKEFLISCAQLKQEVQWLKQHAFKRLDNQHSEIHIRLQKLERVYRVKNCFNKDRALYNIEE